ncbi:MAG: glycosyltransferase [Planctomycetota bacterium]
MNAKILFLAERFPPDLGGVARSSGRIARSLAAIGCDVHVLTWTKTVAPGAVASSVEDGLTIHRLGLFKNQDFTLQYTYNVLEGLHADHGYQATWGHFVQAAGYLAVLFAESVTIPSIVSARGNDVDRAMFPPGDLGRLLWTLERASLITSVSADLARKMNVLLGSTNRRIDVLVNTVDADLFHPVEPDLELRRSLGIHDDEAVLTFSGELREKKGLPYLLGALLQVREVRPACLLVIGDVRAKDADRLRAFAADHPEDGARILVTGALDGPEPVVKHLALSDVFLLPSLWDGMPNSVLEAMACGRIVLASDAGGIPEIVRHGVDGFLLSKRELHRLGDAALDVLSMSESDRKAMEEQARTRVAESFSPEGERRALEKILRRFL